MFLLVLQNHPISFILSDLSSILSKNGHEVVGAGLKCSQPPSRRGLGAAIATITTHLFLAPPTHIHVRSLLPSVAPCRYWCRYAGRPQLCPSYSLRSSQYWKQLVGKLKKRLNACEGEKVLKARTCKKAPAEAHMKLAQHSGGKKKEEKKKSKKKEEEPRRSRAGWAEPEENAGGGTKMMSDAAPVESYCSEGWSSVCSFFVRFFDG